MAVKVRDVFETVVRISTDKTKIEMEVYVDGKFYDLHFDSMTSNPIDDTLEVKFNARN